MTSEFRRVVQDAFALSMEPARNLEPGQLITKSVEAGYADALLALDSDGLPHLLAPVDGGVVEDRRSAAVWITRRELEVDGQARIFADLGCREPDLSGVFDRLVVEVLESVAESGECLDRVQSRTLSEWRHFLSAARLRLSGEVVTGLFGELTVLHSLARSQPHLALDAWVGPQKKPRDFESGSRAIEVKTRAQGTPERVRISSLEQLDSVALDRFVLAVIDVVDDDMGESLGDVVDRVVDLGVPRLALMDRLADVGYVPGMTGEEGRRMKVSRFRGWEVDASFPTLTAANLGPEAPEAIVGVTYAIDLTCLDAPSSEDLDSLTAVFDWGP